MDEEMKAQGFPEEFPELETSRLVLRKLDAGDQEALYANYADEDIARNFLERPLEDISQASQFIAAFQQEFEQGKAITWAVAIKPNHPMVGTCSFMMVNSGCAELGYDLAKAQWGKGIMTEALEAIISYGFSDLGLEKVLADTLSKNSRSINLLNRLGFQVVDEQAGSQFFTLGVEDYENRGT